jgi:hypothetical protein
MTFASGWKPPPQPERLLTNILKLSNKWEITEGQEYAILFLREQVMDAAHRLELSRMFGIDEWVKPAFNELVQKNLTSLSINDVNRIGFTTYTILAKAREAIDQQRKLIAAVPPAMVFLESYKCLDHDKCKASWKETWWRKLGKQLVHPSKPLALSEVMDFLEQTKFPDMMDCCKKDMLTELQKPGGAVTKFNMDEDVIGAAVTAILAYHHSL